MEVRRWLKRGLLVMCLAVLPLAPGLAADVPVLASEFRAALIGKRLTTTVLVRSVTVTYSTDGRYVVITGRDGGTAMHSGTYEVSDGKVCHTPDDRSRGARCDAVTKDGGSYFLTGPDKIRRRVEIY